MVRMGEAKNKQTLSALTRKRTVDRRINEYTPWCRGDTAVVGDAISTNRIRCP